MSCDYLISMNDWSDQTYYHRETMHRNKGKLKLNYDPNTEISDLDDESDIPLSCDIIDLLSLDLSIDPIPLQHKRVIFVSIAQLNACIDSVPSYILSESIFCFKADRSWFSHQITRND